jgi:hypothetical protein
MLITALVMVEIAVDLTEELRSANLPAITVAAAKSRVRSRVAAVTAPSTQAALNQRSTLARADPTPQRNQAAPATPTVNLLAPIDPTRDPDLAVVASSAVVAADLTPEEDPERTSEDGEEAPSLALESILRSIVALEAQRSTAAPQRKAAAPPRSTHAPPRSTHALDPRSTAALVAEEQDFPSHAQRASEEKRLSPSLRTPGSSARSTLTSPAPSH